MSVDDPAVQAFALHKAKHTIEAFASNLRRLVALPTFDVCPLQRGTTAVICGAGPSLPDALEAIGAASESGHTIIAVNTAARAIDEAGIRLDLVVARESLDVSAHLELNREPRFGYALDVHAHPRCFDAAGSAALWFLPGSLQSFDAAAKLGVAPLFAGSAALTAAVALAHRMGFERLILAGVDLAFADDGAAYGAGTHFQDLRASAVRGGVVHLQGREAQAALASSSGQRAPLDAEDVRIVAMQDGSAGYALSPWVDQAEWLEAFAGRCYDRQLQRIGSAGIRLESWKPVTMMLPHRSMDEIEIQGVSVVAFDRYMASVLDQCDRAEAICDAVMSGDVLACSGLMAGCDLVESHAAGDLIRVRLEGRSNPAESIERAYQVIRASAHRVRELVSG